MHGLICFLVDSVKFDWISGRCWDWLTFLRWIEFVTFWIVFWRLSGSFWRLFDSFGELNGCKWPRVTKMAAQGGPRKRFYAKGYSILGPLLDP